MRIRLAVPNRHVGADVLDAALEASTRANDAMLQAGERPTTEELLRAGARWRPERFSDGEHFDLGSTIAERGWGDCDDWAPLFASDLRAMGDEGAHAFVRQSRPNRWHALVRGGDGTEYDPSVWAGMKSQRSVGPAVHGQMCVVGGRGIAILPYQGGWAARADTPWETSHISSVAHSLDPREAVFRAARGAAVVGAGAGLDVDDLIIVGDMFGDLLSAAVPMAANIALPGSGALASGLMGQLTGHGGGGGQPQPGPVPGTVTAPLPGVASGTMTVPSSGAPGPIIVRF